MISPQIFKIYTFPPSTGIINLTTSIEHILGFILTFLSGFSKSGAMSTAVQSGKQEQSGSKVTYVKDTIILVISNSSNYHCIYKLGYSES